MSIKCMTRVWEQTPKKIKGSKLLLLLAIADYAHDNGHAWPGVSTLADKIRMSERHTMRMLEDLASAGVLYIDRRGYNNQYLVTVGLTAEEISTALMTAFNLTPMEIQIALQDLQHGDKLSPCSTGQHGDNLSNMVTTCQEHGDNLSNKVTSCPEHGDMGVTLTVKNPQIEPSNRTVIEPSDGTDVPSTKPPPRKLKHVSTKHPAVQIYKASGITRPPAAVRDAIGQVGKDPTNLDMWQQSVQWWMTSGSSSGRKNPRNVQGMLDVWTDAMTYLEADPDPEAAFALWREVREREGWSRAYKPPAEYVSTGDAATLPEPPPPATEWEQIKAAVELQMAKSTYQAHVASTRHVGHNGSEDTWIIEAPPASVPWLDTRLRSLLERAASQVVGRAIRLNFVVDQPETAG